MTPGKDGYIDEQISDTIRSRQVVQWCCVTPVRTVCEAPQDLRDRTGRRW